MGKNGGSRLFPALTALAVLLGLALILSYPLPLHLSTHAPGDGSDDPAILWNLWWVRYALTELRQSPFESAWMFYPLGVNLVFYTLTTLNGIISIPLQLLFGVVPANSFVVYFELVIAALGMWLFMRFVLAHHAAHWFSRRARDGLAILAAVVFAFGTSKWLYLSLGQFNIASSHWLPWAVLYFGRMWNAPTLGRALREAALCAFFALCTGWTEFTYASFFIQFAALWYLWLTLAAARNRWGAQWRRFTLASCLLGALFLLGMAPVLLLMMQDMRVNGDFLVEGLGFSNVFSNDLLGFFVPGDRHPLFGAVVREQFDFAYLNFAFLGWVTLALSLVGLLSRSTRRHAVYWVLFAAVFALLSLGPTLRVDGREWDLPLPFDLTLEIPLVKANRYPSRYSVMIALCLGVAATWGLAALLLWWRARGLARPYWLAAWLVGLVLFEHLGAPLPLSDYRLPPVYDSVRGSPGRALLDIPLAWRNGFRVTGTQHPAFMFAQAHQTYHEKRLLSGNTSRNPELKFQYFTELPVVNTILALETGHTVREERRAADAAVAPELLRLLDAPDVVVRRLGSDDPAITPEAAIPYLESVLAHEVVYSDTDYFAMRALLPAAPGAYRWDARHPLARLFFAEGWSALPPLDAVPESFSPAVWIEQPDARILLPSIASPGDWTLTFTATVPAPVQLDLALQNPDGGAPRRLSPVSLASGKHRYAVVVPAGMQRAGLTSLWLRLPPSAASFDGESLLVESAALAVGDFAHIYWNGRDLGGTETGYYAALFSEGELLSARRFDTFNDPAASAELAAWLDTAPPGSTLALAACDTVSAGAGTGGLTLGDEVWRALQPFGLSEKGDLRGDYGWSHAFIGVKGDPAQALDDSSPIRPARVFSGAPLRTDSPFARFDGFELTPAAP